MKKCSIVIEILKHSSIDSTAHTKMNVAQPYFLPISFTPVSTPSNSPTRKCPPWTPDNERTPCSTINYYVPISNSTDAAQVISNIEQKKKESIFFYLNLINNNRMLNRTANTRPFLFQIRSVARLYNPRPFSSL